MRSVSKRQIIISLHRQGDSQAKIAEAVGLSQGRISQILKEERLGYEGGQWGGHKPCKMSAAQLLELEGYLSVSAETAGYVGAHWDGRRIQALLSEKFGIQYHVSSIYRLLHQMNYSSQKYTTQDYRQDEQAVAHFVEETLPALKKKRFRKID